MDVFEKNAQRDHFKQKVIKVIQKLFFVKVFNINFSDFRDLNRDWLQQQVGKSALSIIREHVFYEIKNFDDFVNRHIRIDALKVFENFGEVSIPKFEEILICGHSLRLLEKLLHLQELLGELLRDGEQNDDKHIF